MNIKIIDDFLTKSYHKEILDRMSGADFPWYYNSNISYQTEKLPINKRALYEFGFSHTFWDYENGQRENFYAWFIKAALCQMLDVLDCNTILRCRGDMTMYTNKIYEHAPHIDFNFTHFSTIFYVNDSDGDTIFYNKKAKSQTETNQFLDLKEIKRISPKANRLVIFEGDTVHTGSSPNKHKNRIIINSNFLKSKN